MNQNVRFIALFLVFSSFATMTLGFIPKASAPAVTSGLFIKIYLDPLQEENALAKGDIDINDWPLSSMFITHYASNPAITMNQYAELGMMEFDLNNQLWPTGPITTPRIGAKNDFFDPTGIRDLAALHFRRAIAHLSNKAKYTTTRLGGYGYVIETIMPRPAFEGSIDYTTLYNDTAKGIRVLSAGAAAGSTTISVGGAYRNRAYSFLKGDQIVIGMGTAAEGKIITAVDTTANSLTLNTPLQFAHGFGESIVRYVGNTSSIVTPLLSYDTFVGDYIIWITPNNNPVFKVGQWIQVGCTDFTGFTHELKQISAVNTEVTPWVVQISSPLQNAHAAGKQVFRTGSDSGYLYEYDRRLAIGELLEGAFYPVNPSSGPIQWTSNGGTTYENLPNMKLWIRLDDPTRRQVGQDLYNEMIAVGIPAAMGAGAPGLEMRIAERSSCFAAVMVSYDYNIYTGGWSVDADEDFIFDLLHSSMGQYGYATNYAGFKNNDFDTYAETVKYAPAEIDFLGMRFLSIQAQWVANKYCPIVWLWTPKAVKGYRTGWSNVVNEACYGTDNGWSFDLMQWTGHDIIKYGLFGEPLDLNIITSGDSWPELVVPQTDAQLPSAKILSCIYDSLLRRNPYFLSEEVGALATSWSATDSYPGWEGKTVCEFTVRTDAVFNDGTPVKPADVAYSILVPRAAGQGNAWNSPAVMDIDHIQIAGNTVRVFFNVNSQFALHWAGFISIINKDLWNSAIGPGTAAGYTGFIPDDTDGNYYPGTFMSATAIRNYHPREQDANANGIIDLEEDGSGPWSYVPSIQPPDIFLTANAGFYDTVYRQTSPNSGVFESMPISTFIIVAFHGIGNVNYLGGYGDTNGWYTADRKIDIYDLIWLANSLSMRYTDTWGPNPGQYNPDADLNHDGIVNSLDLGTVGTGFWKSMG